MKSAYRLVALCLAFAGLILLFNFTSNSSNKLPDSKSVKTHDDSSSKPNSASPISSNEKVVICVVACGDRLDESLTMLKSALVFTKRELEFVVISDNNLIPAFNKKLTEWSLISNKTFTFVVRPVTFPARSDVNMWKKLFKPCAAQRLFLPVSSGSDYRRRTTLMTKKSRKVDAPIFVASAL